MPIGLCMVAKRKPFTATLLSTTIIGEMLLRLWRNAIEASEIHLSRLDQHGALGENLTIEGIVEDQVFVGDVWKIGDVELEVTAPREPCFKFNAIMGDRLAGKKMFSQGLCGWYFSVRNSGSLTAGASIEIFPGSRKRSIACVFESLAKKTDDIQKKYF